MQRLFAAMLILCGLVVTGATLWRSVRRRRRADALARYAHARRMRFDAEDPLDLPQRYRQFALMRIGHDLRAENLCDGRHDAGRVRTFDLHFEVARGPRRKARRYAVAAVELAGGGEPAPPAARGQGPHVERIGQTMLAYVPMGDAPLDHATALERVTGPSAPSGGAGGQANCARISIENADEAR